MNQAPQRSLRERQQELVRSELVDAALRLVSRVGLDAVTVEAIVAEAALARATLYSYFPGGRDELLREAYREVGRRLLETAKRETAQLKGWDERILGYARVMLAFSSDSELGHFYSVTGPSLQGPATTRGVGSQGYYLVFRHALDEAVALGEVPEGTDTDPLATLLAGSLRDAGISLSRGVGDVERFVRALDRLLDGLRISPRA